MGVESVRLEDSPAETWANTILYRLAIALGVPRSEDGSIIVDPDEVLEQAEEHINAWRDDRCFAPNHANRSQTTTEGENA